MVQNQRQWCRHNGCVAVVLRVLGMTATKGAELVPVFCWAREVVEEVLSSGAVRVVGVVDGEGRVILQPESPPHTQG